jgi:mono/diheme cytochrome c family protein
MKYASVVRYAGCISLCFACSCVDVGACEGPLEGRDTVMVNNTIMYGGQAIMNKACAVGCHLSTATGAERHGVPAGLDFDLLPIDEVKADGTTKTGDSTIVQLTSAQLSGLRKRQKMIVERSSSIWQQVLDGLMPPSGMLTSMMSTIFESSEKKPCKSQQSYAAMDGAQTREVLRNWLACGAPFVETNGKKLDKSSAAGRAGDQYAMCAQDSATEVTLASLFNSTFSECGGCHNSALTGPPSFLDVDTLAKSLRTESACGGKPFVTPGKPEDSYLLQLLKGPNPACSHGRMPGGGLDPLSERAIAEVEAWIAGGAPTSVADLSAQDDTAKLDDSEPLEPSSNE